MSEQEKFDPRFCPLCHSTHAGACSKNMTPNQKETGEIAKELVARMIRYSFLKNFGCSHVGDVDFKTWENIIIKALDSERAKTAVEQEARLKAELDNGRLRENLKNRGQHEENCFVHRHMYEVENVKPSCTCGLEEALALPPQSLGWLKEVKEALEEAIQMVEMVQDAEDWMKFWEWRNMDTLRKALKLLEERGI